MNDTNQGTQFEPIGGSGSSVPGTPMIAFGPLDFGPDRALVEGTNPRTISNILSTQPDDLDVADPSRSGMIYVWGQFTDHDLDLKVLGVDDISVVVPPGDPTLPDGTIIPLTRAAFDPTTGTEINAVTSTIDGSQIYGSDQATADSLRNDDGTMKTSDDGNALPIIDDQFVAGDVRVMENPELTAITTLFVKEHNRLVGVLRDQHPDWSGDRLYFEARSRVVAEEQSITYNEFLPALIGSATPTFQGFDPNVSTQISQRFAVSAFRVGHTQVSNKQVGVDNQGNETYTQTLAESFFNTPAQDIANGIDTLLRHLPEDGSQEVDTLAVNGLRDLLFAPPNAVDLIATDIQRERDAGIGTLNEVRTALGLTPYTSFDQITSDPAVAANIEVAFEAVDKVSLFMGGLAEAHVNGGAVGETFSAIIADQFARAETGDQWFYLNQFQGEELDIIKSTTLADIISRNTDTPILQNNVFINTDRHLSDVAGEEPNSPQLVIGVNDPNAVISGGPACDTIAAGDADGQSLTGGDGADAFKFLYDNHAYTITDFTPGADSIEFLFGSESNVCPDADGNTVVFHGGVSVTLIGVSPDMGIAINNNL